MNNLERVAILGLGWLGLPLAKHLRSVGYPIAGSVGSMQKLIQLNNQPFNTYRIKITPDEVNGDWEAFIYGAKVLIITLPPGRTEGIENSYQKQISQITKNCPKELKVIFTSTTGVYPNTGGIVNEQMEAAPEKPSGKAVKAAEDRLKVHFGSNLTVLRLAGLIGEDRHPGRFLAGKRELKNALVPVNLVHREDCIRAIEQVIKQNCYGEILNVCADKHPIRKDYYQKAAEILKLQPPVFKESNAQEFKIVDNTRSKEKLNFRYLYADPEDLFTTKHPGKLSIVGAGPGDSQLLTLKALQCIKEAEVILYDNLVSEEILKINPQAEHCYVGRKYADQSNQKDRQESINKQLHFHFSQGKKVVRLKSGDPYIYGRAAEEARYLSAHKIPFEVIPGISAALAAANINNIPVTERHRSNALMICTAHTADYSFEQLNGIAALLKAGNTLAVYMGLKSLDKLIPKLIEVCGDDNIPINAFSNVSRNNERIVSSTLRKIRQDVIESKLPMPVVFIVGAKPIEPMDQLKT